jgi:hypothetical protein
MPARGRPLARAEFAAGGGLEPTGLIFGVSRCTAVLLSQMRAGLPTTRSIGAAHRRLGGLSGRAPERNLAGSTSGRVRDAFGRGSTALALPGAAPA